MRTREYDRSSVVAGGGAVQEGGFSVRYDRPVAVGASYPVNRELRDRVYGFFVDQPHRPRVSRHGEANRWEEQCWPTITPIRSYNGVYNENGTGFDNTHVYYDNADLWYVSDPDCGLLKNNLQLEALYGPWVYRWRSRRDLNNMVQQQRNRMYAYNGGIAETIAELPECPQLFRLVNTAKGLRSNITGLSLGIKFGWAPTIEAFQAAISELHNFRNGLSTLRRRTGRQSLRYSGPDSWNFTNAMKRITIAEGDLNRYGLWKYPRLQYHEGVITWSAVVQMRPLYDERLWQLMARLGSIGAIPSLRTLWELIPKSFLIDWFIGIGDVISSIQGNLLYHIDVEQEMWSWKIHDRFSMHLVSPLEDSKLTEKQVKAFYRSSTPPLGSWKVPRLLPGLGSGQISTLALLLGQKLSADTPSLKSLLRRINRFGYR